MLFSQKAQLDAQGWGKPHYLTNSHLLSSDGPHVLTAVYWLRVCSIIYLQALQLVVEQILFET